MCREDVVTINDDITPTEVGSSYRGAKFIDPLYYNIRKYHIKSDILSSLVGNSELMVANIQVQSMGLACHKAHEADVKRLSLGRFLTV